MRRMLMLTLCLAVAVGAGVVTGGVALQLSAARGGEAIYGVQQGILATEEPSQAKPVAFALSEFRRDAQHTSRTLVLPGSQRMLVFGEGVTSWTLRMLPDERAFVFYRKELADVKQVQWFGYELSKEKTSTGTLLEARLIVQHTADKNSRQRNELHMEPLGWSAMPALVGEGIFWTGPRVLVFDGSIYRPAQSLALLLSASLGKSLILWFGLLAMAVVAICALSEIPRVIVRDVAMNLAVALWVVILLRLLFALIYGDLWHALAWHAWAVVPATFVLCVALFSSRHGYPGSYAAERRRWLIA